MTGTPVSLKIDLSASMTLPELGLRPNCTTVGHPVKRSTYAMYSRPPYENRSAETCSNGRVAGSSVLLMDSFGWLAWKVWHASQAATEFLISAPMPGQKKS